MTPQAATTSPDSIEAVIQEPKANVTLSGSSTPGTVSRSLVWFAASYCISIPTFLALQGLVSRQLDQQGYGYFVLITSTTVLLSQIGILGVHRAGLRDAARLDRGDREAQYKLRGDVRVVYRTWLPVVGTSGGVLLALATAGDMAAPNTLILMLVCSVLIIANGHQKIWSSLLRGFGATRSAAMLEGASTGGAIILAIQVATLGVAAYLGATLTLTGIMAIMALSFLLPLWIAYRQVDKIHTIDNERLTLARLRAVAKKNLAFTSTQISAFVAINLEIWIAASILSATDLAHFAAGQRLSLIVAGPLTALQIVMSPVIARLYHAQESATLITLLRGCATIASLSSLLVAAPMLLMPSPTLSFIFGEAYSDAGTVLILLTLGVVVNVITGLSAPLLAMTGHERRIAVVQWLSILLRLPTGFALGISAGSVGLALGSSVIAGLSWLWIMIEARRRLGINTLPSRRLDLRLLRRTVG